MFALGDFGFPGLVRGDRVIDLSDRVGSLRELFEDWEASFAWLSEHDDDAVQLNSLPVQSPCEPRQIIQSGANYYKHVVDLIVAERVRAGDDAEVARIEAREIMDARGEPYLFLGAVSALCGPNDDVALPARGEQHDWELELAAVIAGDGSIAGYTIANDLTTRDLVWRPDLKAIGSDWLRSKNAPTFLPVGPYIVPAAFVDPADLRITLRLNGDTMQDESTADMIFDVPTLLAYAHERMTLLAGDLLLTGSPAGNGSYYNRFLRSGDVMQSTITGLGTQRNSVR